MEAPFSHVVTIVTITIIAVYTLKLVTMCHTCRDAFTEDSSQFTGHPPRSESTCAAARGVSWQYCSRQDLYCSGTALHVTSKGYVLHPSSPLRPSSDLPTLFSRFLFPPSSLPPNLPLSFPSQPPTLFFPSLLPFSSLPPSILPPNLPLSSPSHPPSLLPPLPPCGAHCSTALAEAELEYYDTVRLGSQWLSLDSADMFTQPTVQLMACCIPPHTSYTTGVLLRCSCDVCWMKGGCGVIRR